MNIFNKKQDAIIYQSNVFVPTYCKNKIFDNLKNYVWVWKQLFFEDPFVEIIYQLNKVIYDPEDYIYNELWSSISSWFSWKDIYVPDIIHTFQYNSFLELYNQSKKILPILRNALADDRLPELSHSPFHDPKIWNKLDITSWRLFISKLIRILWDKEVIPYMKKVLFEEEDNKQDISDDYLFIRNTNLLKADIIKTLSHFQRSDILFEYLLQNETPHIRLVKTTLWEIENLFASENILPILEKIYSKYETLCEEDTYSDRLYLSQLQRTTDWTLNYPFVEDTPLQWLILRCIAKIWSKRSLEILEFEFKNSIYYENKSFARNAIQLWITTNLRKINKQQENKEMIKIIDNLSEIYSWWKILHIIWKGIRLYNNRNY